MSERIDINKIPFGGAIKDSVHSCYDQYLCMDEILLNPRYYPNPLVIGRVYEVYWIETHQNEAINHGRSYQVGYTCTVRAVPTVETFEIVVREMREY